MTKSKKDIESFTRDIFNKIVLNATSKAQKKYGFDMTKKSYSLSNTHNNEAGVFFIIALLADIILFPDLLIQKFYVPF